MTQVQFHSSVSDVAVSVSPEQGSPTVKAWNLKTRQCFGTFNHPDRIVSFSIHPVSDKIATFCKDGNIRVFEVRTGRLLSTRASHSGGKSGRVLWLGEDDHLLSVGFDKSSAREIKLYLENGAETTITLDNSPSLIIPIYDPDTKVLMLAGRGESSFQFYEFQNENNMQFLTRQSLQSYTNGVSILPKRYCNVGGIEIMTGYRLLQQSIETFSVTVPRLKREYFQDDIYSLTRDLENPILSAEEWMKGTEIELRWIDLNVKNMPLCKTLF